MTEAIYSAKACLQDLKNIFQDSFGPYGKDVLIQTNVGVIFVTKRTASVLKHLEMKHPIGTMIKQSLQIFLKQNGDHGKLYIFILANLVDVLLKSLYGLHCSTLCNKLAKLSMSLMNINRAVTNEERIRNNFHQFLLETSPEIFLEKYFSKYIQTFLCGQYNKRISSHLIYLLRSVFEIVKFTADIVTFILKYFDEICVNVELMHFTESAIHEGVLLQRECVPRDCDKRCPCKFIMIIGNAFDTTNSIEINMSHEKNYSKLKQCNANILDSFVKVIKQERVNLILFEKNLPKYLQDSLMKEDIVYIQYVPIEELEYISFVYNCGLLSGIQDILTLKDTAGTFGTAEYFQSCVLGKRFSSNLGPIVAKNFTKKPLLPFTFILCSNQKGLGEEYKSTIHSIFTNLKTILQCDNCAFMPSNGVFEIIFSRYLTCNEIKIDKEDSDLKDCLVKCLLEVPKMLWNSSTKTGMKNQDFIKYLISDDWATCTNVFGINPLNGDLVPFDQVDSYESFYSKLNLITSLFEVCAQILRITDIVPIKRIDPRDGRIPNPEIHDSDAEL